jgi:peptidoglycan/LPS O-acetylase OafA/YrhL
MSEARSSSPGLRHQPALDGLRAVAVLLVMAYHIKLPGFHGGRAGVDMFFVLSGFLITALLLDEHAQTGRIRLRAFYMRRILRLYPALIAAAALAVGLAALRMPIFDAGSRALRTTLEGSPFALLYTMNIARAAGWTGGGFLAHTWSLAIEEQFYLVWPPIVLLVMRRSRPALVGGIALLCALTSAVLRAGLYGAGVATSVLFNATFSHVDGIFAGCALGVAWTVRRDIVRRIAHPIAAAGAAIAAIVVIVHGQNMYTYGFLVVVIATVLVSAHLLTRPESRMSALLSTRAPVAIGKRSYGLYLYHWPIFLFIGADTRPVMLVLAFGSSFAAAWLSYRLIETPFLRMKQRWTTRPSADEPRSSIARPASATG